MAFTPRVWHDGDVWNAAAVIDVETRIGNELNVITDAQKAALPGTNGAPSGANKYVTNSDPRNSDSRAPTAHATNHRPGGSDPLVQGVLSQQPVAEVGSGSRRAGRDFVTADFTTNMGLNTPVAIYNLATVNDATVNARNLTNKNAATFVATGVAGVANQAVYFDGTVSNKALYAAEATYPGVFQIKAGSWGAWIKTPKRGTDMFALAKYSVASKGYSIRVTGSSSPVAVVSVSTDGSTDVNLSGTTDVCDEKYHFVVGTFDGSVLKLYVDGVLEGVSAVAGTIFASVAPFNIGGHTADGATNPTSPWFGPVDESFVLTDVLTDDQVRLLYCAKVAHAALWTPTRAYVNVYRFRRGSALATSDFPTTPLRLYNFSAGAVTDAGSNGTSLTPNGSPVSVPGAGGTNGNAYSFITASSQSFSATDTGLPSGTSTRSYGIWFKTSATATAYGIMGWGTAAANAITVAFINTGGILTHRRDSGGTNDIVGPFVSDGLWHLFGVTEDNAALDGLKRKVYLDGRLIGSDTTLATITPGGASGFRIGGFPAATNLYTGQLDEAWVSDQALTIFQHQTLYNKGAQSLGLSPKEAGQHVEMIDASNVYYTLDTIDPQNKFDLFVE